VYEPRLHNGEKPGFAKTGRHSGVPRRKTSTDGFTDRATAVTKFEKLVEALASVGMQTEVRNGDAQSVLLFVRVDSEEHLFGEVYRSR
jgi:hypothetical protein